MVPIAEDREHAIVFERRLLEDAATILVFLFDEWQRCFPVLANTAGPRAHRGRCRRRQLLFGREDVTDQGFRFLRDDRFRSLLVAVILVRYAELPLGALIGAAFSIVLAARIGVAR